MAGDLEGSSLFSSSLLVGVLGYPGLCLQRGATPYKPSANPCKPSAPLPCYSPCSQYVYGKWGGISGWDQFTLPINDFRHKRIWNKDMQFSDLCLTLGGITTGIQILRHVIIYRISSGLPLGTSNTDTWRLKPSTRCQLLVDRSELCTKFIFNFSQLITYYSTALQFVHINGHWRFM